MNSSEQMKKRPIKELLQALQDLGAEVTYKEASGHFPFVIGNSSMNRHEVTIDVEKSSQFLECASDLFRVVSEKTPDSRQRASWNGLCRDNELL